MEFLLASGVAVIALIALAVAVVAAIIILIIMRTWVKVARADEALVISGRKSRAQAKDEPPVTVIVNGRAVVNPISQRHEVISLRSRQVALQVEAQSLDNVTLDVTGVAIVKIGSQVELVRRAAERFASQDKAIEQFTTEQLEGALRGVVATLSVAELMRERKRFSEQIAADVSAELAEQGLVLDSFQIKGITDGAGYIASLGVPQTEEKRREAEIARADAEREITKRKISVEEQNLVERTELDRNRANADAEVGKARAEAEQAEALARATAEQQVLRQRAENRQSELDASVRREAEAERYRQEQAADAAAYAEVAKAEAQARVAAADAEATKVRAQAEAEAIRLEGEAKAASIEAEAAALEKNADVLILQRIVDVLPDIVQAQSTGLQAVGAVTMVGGADSTSPASFVAGESAQSFEALKATTGIDIPGLLGARLAGDSIGRGLRGDNGAGIPEPGRRATPGPVATAE